MNTQEKIDKINEATQQTLTLEYIKEGAEEYGITLDEMLDHMLEDLPQ